MAAIYCRNTGNNMEGWYHNPEELKVNLRVREILKILIECLALVFHFRSLMPDQGCRISQGAVKCKDRAMVEWHWAGRKDSNSEKCCPDAVFPLRTHEFIRDWTEVSVVRNPCFKWSAWEMFQGIYPKRKKEWRSWMTDSFVWFATRYPEC